MYRVIYGLSRVSAILGGVVLSALVLITCLSILGRTLNTILHGSLAQWLMPGLAQALIEGGIGPVKGDFELVEAGMAFCIFAFLPLCQITSSHASVDIFTNGLPQRLQRILRAAIEVAFAVVLVVLAIQLLHGTLSMQSRGQTTLHLQYPVWWGYALALTGAAVAALVGIYMALVRLAEMVTGRVIIADEMGAEH